MALTRLTHNGYGQVELNNVAFRRDGRIEAQCKPNATDFETAKVENGMILAVDNVKREVKLAKDEKLPVALVYSTEHMYDERANGLKDFALNGTGDFLPRLGYLAVGDKFHTNAVGFNSGVTEDDLTKIAATPLYGVPCEEGFIKVQKEATAYCGVLLQVVENATMPDGQKGLKFQVIKA